MRPRRPLLAIAVSSIVLAAAARAAAQDKPPTGGAQGAPAKSAQPEPLPELPAAAPPPSPAPEPSTASPEPRSAPSSEAPPKQPPAQPPAPARDAAATTPPEPPLQRRTRIIVDAAVGWTFMTPTLDVVDPPPAAEESYGELTSGSGFTAEIGFGVRRALTRRFDVRARLAFAFAALHGTTSYSADSAGAQPFYESGASDGSYIELSPSIEAAIRLRPILTAPWYVGIGPRLGPSFVLGSVSVPGVSQQFGVLGGASQSVERAIDGKAHFLLQGLLETGVVFGPDERWDIGARLLAGVANDGHAAFRVLLGVGWSF